MSNPTLRFIKTDANSVTPSKGHPSDAGYDLTVLRKHKDLDDQTALYDTGLKVQIDAGYYVEIMPRSSISKSGYMLANSVGIIDNGYTNNLYVALRRVNPNAPEIEFPYRCAQLIIRKQYDVELLEVSQFKSTDRGDGGFGSTGN